jgi:hypothetical protein
VSTVCPVNNPCQLDGFFQGKIKMNGKFDISSMIIKICVTLLFFENKPRRPACTLHEDRAMGVSFKNT